MLLFRNSLFYNIKKLKIVASTCNYEFESRDAFYSVSDIQYYTHRIIKTWNITTNFSIHIYINKINNRLVFKIKDRGKQKLQMLETMKVFHSTKELVNKTRKGENVSSLTVVEVVLVQCNLVCLLVHDVINLLYYEYWTDEQKYFYEYQ